MSRSRTVWNVAFLAASIAWASECGAQPESPRQVKEEPKRPEYEQDRSEEDWRFLQDRSKRNDPWDPLKLIPLGRENWYLTVAGEIRPFYEFYRNSDWGAGPQDGNGYVLQRFMGSTDFHFGERVRFFFELRSGLQGGRNGGLRPSIDKDALDVSQAFAGLTLVRGEDEPALELKVGRQELEYGGATLVAMRELNFGRNFQGAKLIVRRRGWRVDLLAFRPQLVRPGVFDDRFDNSQALWGAWAARPIRNRSFWKQVDLYYLGLNRKEAEFRQGKAHERRHTLGVLIHGQAGEFRTFGAGNIRAWKYAQRASWSFPSRRLSPVVSVLGAIASGDKDPQSAGLQTFNVLFPTGLYYGYIESSGSPNTSVIHPEVKLTISPTVSVLVRHFSFWRTSAADGIYSQPGFLLRDGEGIASRYIGSLQDLSVRWQADRHTFFEALATYYETGEFLRRTPEGARNLLYLSLKVSYRF